MILTFKQFWQSLRDPAYGQAIISRSFKSALWFWTKIFLVVSIVPTIISMFALTYFTPQLPRFVQNSIPDGFVSVEKGNLHTSLSQAWKKEYDGLIINVDPFSDPEKVADFSQGITVLKDRIIFKDNTNTTTQSLSDIPDFYLTKSAVSEFVSHNLTKIWLIGLATILSLFLIIGSTVWTYNFVSFFSLGLFYLVLCKIMHKKLAYMNLVKLAVYASVISFVFSVLFGLMPSGYSFILNAAIITYFGYRWLKPLPDVTK